MTHELTQRAIEACNARGDASVEDRMEAVLGLAFEMAASCAEEFGWVLPMYENAEVNEATDDAAESVQKQIAQAIRALSATPSPATGERPAKYLCELHQVYFDNFCGACYNEAAADIATGKRAEESPDAPKHATNVDGVIVHGDKPLTEEGREAIRALIAAATKKLAPDQEQYLHDIRTSLEGYDPNAIIGGPRTPTGERDAVLEEAADIAESKAVYKAWAREHPNAIHTTPEEMQRRIGQAIRALKQSRPAERK